jgi:hypothetical protein
MIHIMQYDFHFARQIFKLQLENFPQLFSFLSVGYFMTHSVASTYMYSLKCRMKDEWKIGKHLQGRHYGLMYLYPSISLEGLKKTTITSNMDNWCPNKDSKTFWISAHSVTVVYARCVRMTFLIQDDNVDKFQEQKSLLDWLFSL